MLQQKIISCGIQIKFVSIRKSLLMLIRDCNLEISIIRIQALTDFIKVIDSCDFSVNKPTIESPEIHTLSATAAEPNDFADIDYFSLCCQSFCKLKFQSKISHVMYAQR